MTSLTTIRFARTPRELDAVKDIYRANKRELGFLPDGAFDERFESKQIVVAMVDDIVAGYVLYSINLADEVRIAHLAIAQAYRGIKLSSRLIDYLKTSCARRSRIRLNCRADFPAAKVWQRLGFVACRRLPGRKLDGSELIAYQFSLNETPLFDNCEVATDVPIVVCDANVCMDIEDSSRPRHEAASGLLADWLVDEINLRVTKEVFNDFDRQETSVRTKMISAIRSSWDQIDTGASEVEKMRLIVRDILGVPKDDSSASDQRHLAIAAASNASAFATYDEELLEKSSEILSKTGLRVQRPSEIITEIDAVIRANTYKYRDLKNSGLERLRAKSAREIETDQFIKSGRGETRKSFESFLDGALSRPEQWQLHRIRDTKDCSVALVAVKSENDLNCTITYLRVAHRFSSTRFGRTLIDYIAHQPLGSWNSNQPKLIRLDDSHLAPEIATACLRRGFLVSDTGELWRISLPGLWSQQQLLDGLTTYVQERKLPQSVADQLATLAVDGANEGAQPLLQRLEHLIHPGKLSFGDLPTYVIPIQPEWAQELFDFRIWRYTLLTPETRLVINPDSVYYKRPKNSPRTNYGRILWYVSGGAKNGGNAIRACSLLTNGILGTVKDLFRRYELLGVFEWPQLMQHFGAATEQAFAIEFTDTELLPKPVSFDNANDSLELVGMKRQIFASSVEITNSAFREIYQRANTRD